MARVKKVPPRSVREPIIIRVNICLLDDSQAALLVSRLKALHGVGSVARIDRMQAQIFETFEISISPGLEKETAVVWLMAGTIATEFQDELLP